MDLLQIKNSWYAKQYIAPKLINDNVYALGLAVKKLDSVNVSTWRERWNKYNGKTTTYAPKIIKHMRRLESCGYFKWG